MSAASGAAPPRAASTTGAKLYDFVLAAVVVYLPYQTHFTVEIPLKGLNIVNLLFLLVLAMVLLRKGPKETHPTPLKGRFVFLFAMMALSFVLGEMNYTAFIEDDVTMLKNNIFFMLFYFLYFHAVRELRTLRVVFLAILFVTFLVSLQGVRQALDYGIGAFNPMKRVTGPYGAGSVTGANLVAAFYVVFVPVAFSVFLLWKSRPFVRMASLLTVALGVMAAFYTYSRQSYVALSVLFLLQSARRAKVVAIIVLIGLATYQLWAPEGVIERIEMTSEGEGAASAAAAPGGPDGQLDESTESRFLLWHGGMQLLASRPWGIGLFHFHDEIGSVVPSYAGFDAHNAFVLTLVECGPQGLAALLWLLVGLLGLARRVEKVPGEEARVVGASLLVAMLGVVLTNLFGSRVYNGEVMTNLWILAALGARLTVMHAQGELSER